MPWLKSAIRGLLAAITIPYGRISRSRDREKNGPGNFSEPFGKDSASVGDRAQ
jgi:hypothetical protein